MNSDRSQFLNLRRLPGRLTAEQAAWLLGLSLADIPILMGAGLLKPLGKPAANAPRYFARNGIEELAADGAWLDKASAALARYWRSRNARLRGQSRSRASLPGA